MINGHIVAQMTAPRRKLAKAKAATAAFFAVNQAGFKIPNYDDVIEPLPVPIAPEGSDPVEALQSELSKLTLADSQSNEDPEPDGTPQMDYFDDM